ncbi:MAG: RNA polymerase sigma factor [Opitutales bacterium]|jgi:RNA polymerase sigma-70 factor (ECF subfamily)|tara:strand:- start:555 stop:1169 length:615 start_codon:yes stop_codon:yes gene_type:complete
MQDVQNRFLPQGSLFAMSKNEPLGNTILSDDQLLMGEVATGSHVAMEQIITTWKDALFRFFDRSLKNKADAEDLTQRVFIRVYQSASRYQPSAKFSTYLFTIARNLLIDEIKKNNRRQMSIYSDELAQGQSVDQVDQVKEWNEVLDFAIKEIPEYYSTALLLRVQRELTYQEIADIMKVSESRVKTWIHRARSHLKKTLTNFRK